MIRNLYKILFCCLICAFSFGSPSLSAQSTTDTHASPYKWVFNPDGILSSSAASSLNAKIMEINDKSGAKLTVAIFGELDKNIDDAATELFNQWGIGRKGAENGILLIADIKNHAYAIRTGRGIGEVLTDLHTNQIAKEYLIPNFKEERYDEGILQTVEAIGNEITTSEAIETIQTRLADARESDSETLLDLITFYLWCSVALTLAMLIIFLFRVSKTRGLDRHARYRELNPFVRMLYAISYIGVGIPFLLYFPVKQYVNKLRNGEHLCPNCKTKMNKLDEIQDNEHLTPAQDAEERYNSVDYDVWLCPNCGEEDVYAFENADSGFEECPHCHARTARYLRDRVVKLPTTKEEGLAVKEFSCLNCKKISQKPFKLPRQVNAAGTAAAAAPFIFLGGMGRGGGGFGGGGFGSGFGGGSTGGGGSSGSW